MLHPLSMHPFVKQPIARESDQHFMRRGFNFLERNMFGEEPVHLPVLIVQDFYHIPSITVGLHGLQVAEGQRPMDCIKTIPHRFRHQRHCREI